MDLLDTINCVILHIHQLGARYLKGYRIPTKIESGQDWAGYPDFLTNQDWDRVRQPDSLNFRGNSGKIEANPDSPQFLA